MRKRNFVKMLGLCLCLTVLFQRTIAFAADDTETQVEDTTDEEATDTTVDETTDETADDTDSTEEEDASADDADSTDDEDASADDADSTDDEDASADDTDSTDDEDTSADDTPSTRTIIIITEEGKFLRAYTDSFAPNSDLVVYYGYINEDGYFVVQNDENGNAPYAVYLHPSDNDGDGLYETLYLDALYPDNETTEDETAEDTATDDATAEDTATDDATAVQTGDMENGFFLYLLLGASMLAVFTAYRRKADA